MSAQFSSILYILYRSGCCSKIKKMVYIIRRQPKHTPQLPNSPIWVIAALTMAPNDTAYNHWSCHGGYKLLCKLCQKPPIHCFLASRPCGHVGWLLLLLIIKVGDVETNSCPHPKPIKDIDKGTSYRSISLLSVIEDTGEEPSSLHNSKHTKHAHTTRIQNTTLYIDGYYTH